MYALRAGSPLLFFLAALSSALQVTPKSPCFSACIDDSENPSDVSTDGSDIICSNAEYSTTAAGVRFQKCVSCLQTSPYTNIPESDQLWFIYNLRYAVDWCLFGYPNNTRTIGGPCVTSQACMPLAMALEDGSLSPSTSSSSTYGYCTADDDAFSGTYWSRCTDCLRASSGYTYLANFLIALQAGCTQQPPFGTVIGLNDIVFSNTQVVITTPSSAVSSSAPGSSAPMSTGVTIGVIVASIVLLIILISIIAICLKKKRQRRKAFASRRLHTNCDVRFGAIEITSPQANGFIDPYSAKPHAIENGVLAAPPYTVDQYDYGGLPQAHLAPPTQKDANMGTADTSPTYTHPNIPVPVHRAYIPRKRPSTASIESDHTSISSSPATSTNPTPTTGTSCGRTSTTMTTASQNISPQFSMRSPNRPAETFPIESVPPYSPPNPKPSALSTPRSGVPQPASTRNTLPPTPRPPCGPLVQRAPYEPAANQLPQVPVRLGNTPDPSAGRRADRRQWGAASDRSSVEQWPGTM